MLVAMGEEVGINFCLSAILLYSVLRKGQVKVLLLSGPGIRLGLGGPGRCRGWRKALVGLRRGRERDKGSYHT